MKEINILGGKMNFTLPTLFSKESWTDLLISFFFSFVFKLRVVWAHGKEVRNARTHVEIASRLVWVTQAGLNSRSSHLGLPNAGITEVCPFPVFKT
jgi:hypothetical protein